MKVVKAWGLEEKTGGRAGKLITLNYVPYWHPIRTAVFVSRGDAIAYMRNAKLEDRLRVTKLNITIDREAA
jgi:hypothetical protein